MNTSKLKEEGFVEIEARVKQVGNAIGISIPISVIKQMGINKGDFIKGFIKISKKLVPVGREDESK